jgi:hypothetical protein
MKTKLREGLQGCLKSSGSSLVLEEAEIKDLLSQFDKGIKQ